MVQYDKVLGGILAVTKPAGISSAQVIRELQKHFKPSKLFAPWFDAQTSEIQQRIDRASNREAKHQRKKLRQLEVKIGHGGTLDPLATGVLITGIGAGTKVLPRFLLCNKIYETIVVFGASTDSYDRLGKILGTAGTEHVTRDKVEEALPQFRGAILQIPPVYSAIRIQGKRLYEYMREGKEIPAEVKARNMNVSSMEILEWWDAGQHDFKWPMERADKEDRVAAKIIDSKLSSIKESETYEAAEPASNETPRKRKRDGSEDAEANSRDQPAAQRLKSSEDQQPLGDTMQIETPASPSSSNGGELSPLRGPAAKIRMEVSSGFYVRSLCHDLGKALGSMGFMAELSRTKQADYELGKNVFDFNILEKGEETWAPEIQRLLREEEQHIPPDRPQPT